jgi:apolipoprotein D and lipocalin family protein
MYRKVYFIFAAILLVTMISGCNTSNSQTNHMKTVENVDLVRYMGTWYEIARFQHSFEKGLVGVSATYALKKNGKVEVLNQGYKDSLTGKLKKAKGFAKVPDPNVPGRLMVYFFWPFGGEYLILDLDENYQYVLVGDSSKKYLWILCRTPKMDEATYNNLLKKAETLGFDTSKLVKVLQ